MKLIYSLFKKDYSRREDIITMTSGLGIVVNFLIAGSKVIIGLLASSIAIVSEGINNATDALTSILTLIGTKLAGKHPDEKHPFGHGRIEYLTSLFVSVLITVTGIEMLISAIKLISEPEVPETSYISLIIVAGAAFIKFFLGLYTIKMGKKSESSALIAVGTDCRNDAFASVITIVSVLIFIIFDLNLDAWAGIIISLLIIKAGLEVLLSTSSELIGRPGEHELAQTLYHEIRKTDGIINAVDMMLHNYGPDSWTGSVNVEIDHDCSVGEMYQKIHELQLRIMHEYKVTMVFGVYAVDNDHEETKAIRIKIAEFVKSHEHLRSYHALYIEPNTNNIYVDFIVDYQLRDWEALKTEFLEYMAEFYPDKNIILTIETEFV